MSASAHSPTKQLEEKTMKKYYKVSGIDKEGYLSYSCTCYKTREDAENAGKRDYLKYKVEEIERD